METAFARTDERPGDHALLLAAVGTGALFASLHFTELGQNDHMTLIALSFVCFAIAGVFLFLGTQMGAICRCSHSFFSPS